MADKAIVLTEIQKNNVRAALDVFMGTIRRKVASEHNDAVKQLHKEHLVHVGELKDLFR